MPAYEFIQLDRTFHELSKHAQEADDFDLSQAFQVGKKLTWNDLIDDYRTVILSEAGFGKTEEIRQVTERLRSAGKPAFFLRLEHLSQHFDGAFEAGLPEEFESWIASNDDGWLLLD